MTGFPNLAVRCQFSIRTPAEDGKFRYDRVSVPSGPADGGMLSTTHPPLVGDLIFLWNEITGKGGAYRVLERSWTYPDRGSAGWPYDKVAPTVGPLLTVIVETAEGPYRDEAELPEDDDIQDIQVGRETGA